MNLKSWMKTEMDFTLFRYPKRGMPLLAMVLLLALIMLPVQGALAAAHVLKSLEYNPAPGDGAELRLTFDGPAPAPKSFAITNPARITLDFPATQSQLQRRYFQFGSGVARSVNAAQARDRTRIVVNLAQMMDYQTFADGNTLVLKLTPKSPPAVVPAVEVTNGNQARYTPAPTHAAYADSRTTDLTGYSITNIDFRRGAGGAGRVLITLSDTRIPVDIEEQGSKIVVKLKGAGLAPGLQRRMDVTDFATPVTTIDAKSSGSQATIIISATGEFSQIAYQSGNTYTVEVRPVKKNALATHKKKEVTYSGERLSLNFQSIEVRSVLQLIADFTGLNIVVSDQVRGEITLRLKDVPWDQALAIILRTQGLDKRQQGNVLYIDKAENIRRHEKEELQATVDVQERVPLKTEIITLNYADATEMAHLLKSGSGKNSILSDRGSVTIDKRTNSLLVQDTPSKLDEIRALITKLDVSVKQVMIETRIVTASDKFTHELGVAFSGGNQSANASGTLGGDFDVSLGANNPAGTVGLKLTKIPLGAQLDLELSAAQVEDQAEIIANPRIITSNKRKARIEQGVEIPYQEATSSGATNTAFKKAVLSLEVVPHITKDNRINLELVVSRDSVGAIFNGVPSIDTREVETQVLVRNGQTIVLGGIFEETRAKNKASIPFFGDLPLVGKLFRHDINRNDKSELLIFVTPKIIDADLDLP